MNSKYGQIGIRGLISIMLGISIFLAVYYGMSRDYKSLCDGFASTISALRKDIVRPYKDLSE